MRRILYSAELDSFYGSATRTAAADGVHVGQPNGAVDGRDGGGGRRGVSSMGSGLNENFQSFMVLPRFGKLQMRRMAVGSGAEGSAPAGPRSLRTRPPGRAGASSRTRAARRRPAPRVRSHCRFRKRGTKYFSESGAKWINGRTKRQCDRARTAPPRMAPRTPRLACSAARPLMKG